ncbi:MAG TPA: PBSX family phage terminase large subunit, partial [Candidatus Angelobacter sp.]|nr:PBSX family phage terminase large subunit [Candidatus Angelobacter sp.]
LLILGAAKPLRIMCAREIQNSIAESVHALLGDQVKALGLEGHYRVLQNEIRGVNGTEVTFRGLRQQNITSIKSFEGADICWVEEANAVTKRSWEILIPTIRKADSEIWVSFNPELDSDDTYQRFVANPPPGAIVIPIGYRDNPWFPKTLENERLHLQKTDAESYDNVWEGRPRTTVEGAIYKREIADLMQEQRVRSIPYDPKLKVHTVWDLGFNDAMTIIFVQRLQGELRLLDYIEDSHKTLAEYVAMIHERKWVWGSDWIPHDGEARDIKTGKSAHEVLRALGRDPKIVPKMDVEAGIKAARLVFPRCYFNRDKTQRLLDCLKRYRRSIPTTTNEPASPLHDEYSHGADAFRYLAVVADKLSNDDERKPLKLDMKGYA